MLSTEHIHQKLAHKESRLNGIHEIIGPELGVSAQTQAEWMINLLQQVYTEHGIAKSPEKVVQSIASNQCRCWFILEHGTPVAMAALVTQSDGSVELGRAVAISPGLGLGGIAMMRAGLDQIENGDTPLVAEVRVADKFEGVPSGEATQNILFGQFGLKPHALAPMFNHGNPVRQEMFALATSQDRQRSESLVLPENRNAQRHLNPIVTLNRNIFDSKVVSRTQTPNSQRFELVQTAPFSVLIPSQHGSSLEVVEQASLEQNVFALLPVEMNVQNCAAIVKCLESGWVACGVDRNVGDNGHPILLLGKLRAGTLLAPSQIVADNLSKKSTKALSQIDRQFRNG
jgi:hypothetical protein